MSKLVYRLRHILLLFILLLGFYLRSDNLYTWPRTGATFDEYAWTWLGINLIQNHIPESWSRHSQYFYRKDIKYQTVPFTLVKPYLEHPPLFGLAAGSYALLTGIKDMYHVNISGIRGFAVILGILSIVFIYLFAKEVYGLSIGLLSAFIYAIVPTVVIGSRIIQNENFFIPFFLLSLFLVSKYLRTNNVWLRNIAAIICGLLTLAKIPWIAGALSIFVIFFFLKRYKDAFKFMFIVIPIFLLFFVYGIYFDSKLFFSLWNFQLHRYDIAFDSLFALFTSPFLVDRFLVDGWIYFGWIAIFLLLSKNIKNNYIIIFPFLTYFLIFIFAIPNEPSHGWYRYPFYPFMVIATALFIKEYFNKNYLLTFIFLIFTGMSLLQLSWGQSFGFSFSVFRFFLIWFIISITPVFFFQVKKITSIFNFLSLFWIFLLSIWSVLNYNEQ